MKTEINNVSSIVLQEQLNTRFGSNVFTVVVDTVTYKFYLEYMDSTDSTLVSTALELAANQSNKKFIEIRSRLYDQIDRMSQKTILRYRPEPPNETLVNEATEWLTDTAQSCPLKIVNMALLQDIDNKAMAQNIVAANSVYKSFLINVANMRDQTLTQLLNATSITECKTIATVAANYFNDLEKTSQVNFPN